MSDTSSVSKTQSPEGDSNSKAKRRSYRMFRRKRSLLSIVNQRLDRMLRTRNVFRAGSVLLLLAGFLLVSYNNRVLAPDDSEFSSVTSEVHMISSGGSTAPDPDTLADTSAALEGSDDRALVEPVDVPPPASFSMVRLAYNGPVTDLTSSGLLFNGAAEAATTGSAREKAITTTIPVTAQSDNKSNTYVVNEGGSLWRTGRRFIDDEVLLDKLIDNLSESGMNVRSVRPGVEVIVNDLGSKGMLVVVEQDGDTYESYVVNNNVSSSVRR